MADTFTLDDRGLARRRAGVGRPGRRRPADAVEHARCVHTGVRVVPCGLPARHAAQALVAAPHGRARPALRQRRLAGHQDAAADRYLAAGPRRHLQARGRGAARGPHHPIGLVRAQAPKDRRRGLEAGQRQERGQLCRLPFRGRPRPFRRRRPAHAARSRCTPAPPLDRLPERGRRCTPPLHTNLLALCRRPQPHLHAAVSSMRPRACSTGCSR